MRPPPSEKPFIIPLFIPHSGCFHQCIFCNQKVITGADADISITALSNVIAEFLKYKRWRNHVEVAFYGGNFLGLPDNQIHRLLNLATSFFESGQIQGIRFSTRPDTIYNETLELIHPFPVSTIELGVQSMNNRVLDASNRGHTAEDTVQAVGLLKATGYKIGLQMMTGLPEDTCAGTIETAKRIIALKPDFIRIYPTLVLKGSPLARLYKDGKYTPLTLDDCVDQMKMLYSMFLSSGIPVIRMGLQASEELNNRSIALAGPYHPALGHMVLSAVMLDHAIKKLKHKDIQNNRVTLVVHPKSYSRMQGLNKENITAIRNMFGVKIVKIIVDNTMGEDEVELSD